MDLGNIYDADSDDENRSHLQHSYRSQLQQNQEQRDGDPDRCNSRLAPINAQEGNSSMNLNGLTPDQIYYQQVIGKTSSGMPLSNQQTMGFEPNPNFHYAPSASFPREAQQAPPTNDEILDAPFGVRVGLIHFPTLGAAICAAASLIPADPGFSAILVGNTASWCYSMADQYPYYDDGPRYIGQESPWQWVKRVVNARNQMGIIRRQEPLGMDFKRADETVLQTRKRRHNARYRAEVEDAKHKRKLDPERAEYDARYAAIWRAQQIGIRNHNAHQRAVGLQNRRAFDVQFGRPAGPDPQLPHDEGDDLYDFAWHRRQSRSLGSEATAPQQYEQSVEQGLSDGSDGVVPIPTSTKFTRCTMCKKHKKGCDLGYTGLPCTKCKARGYVCEGCGTLRVGQISAEKENSTSSELRGRRPAKSQSAESSTSGSSADVARLVAHGNMPGPAPDFQGVESRLGREEALPSPRLTSQQRGALFSDNCDNCQWYASFCEDTRPCSECIDRNLVCSGSYMDNPYQSPSTDAGSDGSENALGSGSFGQVFGWYRDFDINGDMNNPYDSHYLNHGTGLDLAISSIKTSLETYLASQDSKGK